MLASPFAVFNHKIFYIPNEGPVVETYLDFHGKSVVMTLNANGFVNGLVETTILFRQGDQIVTYDKKVLTTPEMMPEEVVDFLDVQRFRVPPGSYTIELQMRDLNDPSGTQQNFETDIVVPEPLKGPFFSDIELISAYKKTGEPTIFSKSGYDLLPMVSDDHAGGRVNELLIYSELYNTNQLGEGAMFLLTHYVAHGETGDVMPDTQTYERKKAGMVVPSLSKLDITDLETGDYDIVVEARTRDNEVITRQTHRISRNHPGKAIDLASIDQDYVQKSWAALYDNKPQLYEYIQATRPISDGTERYQLETLFENFYEVELPALQQYFLAFWQKRNQADSEGEWLKYKEKVDFVEQEFGTRNKRGYETDRGRVYLQYGPPIDIVDRANEPSSYPYQIWRYYKADRWNNVRFVFFDPQLTGMDYDLLHCERIPGEIRNPQWRLLLEQRNTPMNNVDRQSGNQHFGGRIDDFFDNPR